MNTPFYSQIQDNSVQFSTVKYNVPTSKIAISSFLSWFSCACALIDSLTFNIDVESDTMGNVIGFGLFWYLIIPFVYCILSKAKFPVRFIRFGHLDTDNITMDMG